MRPGAFGPTTAWEDTRMPVNHRPTPPEGDEPCQPIGTFVKDRGDGHPMERVAYTPSDVVALTFDGWQPRGDTAPADAPSPPADEPARSRTPTKNR